MARRFGNDPIPNHNINVSLGGIKDRFRDLDKIGEGTYGVVYKAVNRETEQRIALKKIRIETNGEGIPSTALREISLLFQLTHQGIVKLHDVVTQSEHLYLVFEFMDYDMKSYMEKIVRGREISLKQVKSLTYQMLDALAFCHERRVLHRDLKPQNLLLNENGVIKIADFGLARIYSHPMRAYTHEVVTLWYRAPEILLGSRKYSAAVDIWSLGCIFGELMMKEALFQGDSEIDEIFKIFQVLGTPTELNWPGIRMLPEFRDSFPKWKVRDPLFKANIPKDGLLLLKSLLKYDPLERCSAPRALRHEFFHDDVFPPPLVNLHQS